MKWRIEKEFHGEYGHRVWSQRLDATLCAKGDNKCACRHPHGHSLRCHLFLEADNLDDRGMVVDFKEMGFLKDFIDTYIDHKFLIDVNDPLFESFVMSAASSSYTKQEFIRLLTPVMISDIVACRVVDFKYFSLPESPESEFLEGITVIDFIPTSERLSKWIWEIASAKLNPYGIKVARVDWHETAKSCASFFGESA